MANSSRSPENTEEGEPSGNKKERKGKNGGEAPGATNEVSKATSNEEEGKRKKGGEEEKLSGNNKEGKGKNGGEDTDEVSKGKTEKSEKIAFVLIGCLLFGLLLLVIVNLFELEELIDVEFHSLNKGSCVWNSSAGEAYVREKYSGDQFVHKLDLEQVKANVIDVENFLDHGSIIQMLSSFGDDISYDWTCTNHDIAPEKHAVSLRLEGNHLGFLQDLVMDYLKAALGKECVLNNVLVVNGDKDTWSKDRINKHIIKTKKNGESISLIVVTACDQISDLLQLKSHLDSPEIVVDDTTGLQVHHKGVGFIFLGATLQGGAACHDIDTEEKDEQVFGWKRSFLGRITYRSRVCLHDPVSIL